MPTNQSPAHVPVSRDRILVAEDDVHLNRLIVAWLRRAPLEVDSVFDGESAIAAIKANEYAAVLLDIMMPVKTGFDVIEFIRDQRPDMLQRVIVMTAGGESIINQLETNTIYKLIEKPFDLGDLLRSAIECVRNNMQAQLSVMRPRADEAPRRRALVVDADDASRSVIENPLRGGFVVDSAPDGRAAIEKLRANKYDVVLLDLKTPDDGLDVVGYLRDHDPAALDRVVVVTVSPEAARGAPVGAVLSKPLDGDQLAAFVTAHLLRVGPSQDGDSPADILPERV